MALEPYLGEEDDDRGGMLGVLVISALSTVLGWMARMLWEVMP